ncbi:MAG: hypothetical protein SPL02_00855 [Bacilli bacterium]|nr:hypothetical protein [Bacilli bacterium]
MVEGIYLMGLRDVARDETTASERMAKTFATAILVCCAINLFSCVYLLVNQKTNIDAYWIMSFQSALIIFISIYGFLTLLGIGLGLYLLLNVEKMKVRSLCAILAIPLEILLIGSTIPYFVLLKSGEFLGLNIAVIVCVCFMNLLLFSSIEEEKEALKNKKKKSKK